MQKERTTHEERAQKQCTCTAQRVTNACDFYAFFAGAGRVCCAKTASNCIETFANSSGNRESFPQISVQRFFKENCRAQGNLRDLRCMHIMNVRMFGRRSACVCSCDRAGFQKFQREILIQNRAVFERKTARFWCKKSAPHTRSEHRSSAHAPHNV